MLAWSWMPGIDPDLDVDSGVPKTSSSPEAVRPMKTILSLKTAGSSLGVFPVRISCSDGEQLAELVRRIGAIEARPGRS